MGGAWWRWEGEEVGGEEVGWERGGGGRDEGGSRRGNTGKRWIVDLADTL